MHGNKPQPQIATEITTQVRAGDYEHFLAIQLAPKDKRAALYALTAFHCEISAIADKVSEPMMGHIRLAWWREAVAELAVAAPPRQHPVTLALAPVLRTHPELVEDLHAMLHARGAALEEVILADAAAWAMYVEGTVTALHRAWARVLDTRQATAQAADIQEQANICALIQALREIPRMAALGVTHLPPDLLAANAISSLAPSAALNGMVLSALQKLLATDSRTRLRGALRPLDGVLALRYYTGRRLQQVGGNPYRLRLSRLGQVWVIVKLTDL